MANCRTHRNGPWGGCVGDAKDVIGVPQRLESITIRSGWVIDSLEFSYIGEDGNRHTRGPWGGFAGNNVQKVSITLENLFEYIHMLYIICWLEALQAESLNI